VFCIDGWYLFTHTIAADHLSLSSNVTVTQFTTNVLYLSTYTITICATPHDINTSLCYLLTVTHIYLNSLTLSHICTDHLICRILPKIVEPLSLFSTIISSFWPRSSLSFQFSCQDTNLPIYVPADKHQAVAFLYCCLVLQFQPSTALLVLSRHFFTFHISMEHSGSPPIARQCN